VIALALAAAAGVAAPAVTSLSVSPPRVVLAGAGQMSLRVAASRPVPVEAAPAGFALDLRGRPRIVPTAAGGAARWLTVRPRRFVAGPAGTFVTVTMRPPAAARPGDHDALLLLTALPPARLRVDVRARIGVVVSVRVPGPVTRRLELRGVRVRRRGRLRVLELAVANRGDVTESLRRRRLTVVLMRRGRVFARLLPVARELLPRSSGVVEVPYRGRVRGRVTARVVLAGAHGRVVHGYPLRL